MSRNKFFQPGLEQFGLLTMKIIVFHFRLFIASHKGVFMMSLRCF